MTSRSREPSGTRPRPGEPNAAVEPAPLALPADAGSGVPCLFLIGYRGTGKSTVARLLAEQLGWDWVDADVLLEARAGRSIRQIFAEEGEAGFRDREEVLLAELGCLRRQVIATGGGVVLRPANRARLRQAGHCVWLTADAATLWQRLQQDASTAERRPVLSIGGQAEIEDLLRQRQPLYRECADLIVDTTGRTPAEVVQRILDSRLWLRVTDREHALTGGSSFRL